MASLPLDANVQLHHRHGDQDAVCRSRLADREPDSFDLNSVRLLILTGWNTRPDRDQHALSTWLRSSGEVALTEFQKGDEHRIAVRNARRTHLFQRADRD